MKGFVLMTRNFVNLGSFYSIPPWGQPRPSYNHVNLGKLYGSLTRKEPSGWGYFEDGSIFIKPKSYISFEAFEAEMKLLQPFIIDPSPNLDQIRTTDPTRGRLIVIASELFAKTYTIGARNARTGEKIVTEEAAFERIAFDLDESGSNILSAKVYRKPLIPSEARRRGLVAVLSSFFGTLINGVLQPNVRLGNGLKLSSDIRLHQSVFSRLGTETSTSSKHHNAPLKSGKNKVALASNQSTRGRTKRRTQEASKYVGDNVSPTREVTESLVKERGVRERETELDRREHELNERERALSRLQRQLSSQKSGPARNSHRSRRESEPLPLSKKSPSSSPRPTIHSPYQGRGSYQRATDREALKIIELEHELHQSADLTWNFAQQHKLARASRSPDLNSIDSDFEVSLDDSADWTNPNHYNTPPNKAPKRHSSNGEQRPFEGHVDAHDSTPPQPLEELGTRIMLPRRKSTPPTSYD